MHTRTTAVFLFVAGLLLFAIGAAILLTPNAFFATKQMYYDLYINLLMERGEAKELDQNRRRALHAAEKASARHLVEVLHSGSMTEPGRSGTELVEVLWEARHEREDLLSEIGSEDPNTEQQTRLRELDRRILMLNRQFQGDRQTQTNLAESAILKADAIQQLADPGSLILVYHLGDKKSHLWAVSQDDIQVYSLPGRVELLPLITQAHELLRESESGDAKVISQRDKALSELSNQLIAPVLKDGNYQRLGIVANGPLQLIPFAALPIEPDIRLLERYELVYLPSASVLGALREQLKDRELAPKLLLAFADPVFDSGPSLNRSPGGELGEQSSWVRLPKTLEEAQSIKRIATRLGQDDNVSILTGYQATRKAVLSNRSSEYRILHFATHGLADARDPNQSSLVFSLLDKDGRAVDGYLRLNEISHLKLNADLIVLSACRTAFGKEVRGEGLISLARGFMFAGAPRVVATLWQVNDVSTSRLMEYFYVEMLEKNQRPAAALREAQLKIMREYDLDLFHWSGFVQVGDWR